MNIIYIIENFYILILNLGKVDDLCDIFDDEIIERKRQREGNKEVKIARSLFKTISTEIAMCKIEDLGENIGK